MKSACVTLIRDGDTSPMMNKTYDENIRGFNKIQYTPTHLIFELQNGNIVGYKSDRVSEFHTYDEKE